MHNSTRAAEKLFATHDIFLIYMHLFRLSLIEIERPGVFPRFKITPNQIKAEAQGVTMPNF